ncbi:tRNA (adenosine(37)-N6)-threonylcarbamoyltransferase complex dimerization subunit type 1 TsaB [Frondihabitans cladoniiphilus]|uniref:tRNA (Adenosine(37)-N6)-threonylcarbamoyltransferase complex dimerization subunit type 1 TsaB n=1 Tax=Frondihabitans cladoniiphilus TaxID=715785 RepID=A0ABP8VWE5_9MICO
MLLAIDTSSGTSVAVVDREGGVLAERTELDTRRHAEVIGLLIQECLTDAGIEPARLSAVVAGMGPGPFTGLRVGIAAARAFAFGAGKPCLPLVSHDAIAFERLGGLERALGQEPESRQEAPLVVVTDARRREVYFSVYSGIDAEGLPVRVGEPGLCKPGDLEERLRASHALALAPNANTNTNTDANAAAPLDLDAAERTDPTDTVVSAAALGMLAETLFSHKRSFARDEPLYLRSPDVTVPGAPKRVS